jgi:hypothetical protein
VYRGVAALLFSRKNKEFRRGSGLFVEVELHDQA